MAIITTGGSTPGAQNIDPTSFAARTTLYDAAGNTYESVLDANTGDHYLGVSFRQDVHGSVVNSSTAAIASGAFFTGVAEFSTGVAGIQVNVAIDQAVTVFVDQGPNGADWPLTDSWSIPTGAAGGMGISRTVQATDLYYRVRVQNNGAIPTVSTRITTALCPVVEALPRALSPGGNLKVTPAADWQDSRMVQGLYAVSTFRTIGSAASPQYVFSIENPSGNVNNIVIRSLSIMSDSTAALLTVAQQVQLARITSPGAGGGGTTWAAATIPKYRSLSPFDRTVSVPNATAIPRQGTASDGGVLTTIVPGVLGSYIWQQYLDRMQTAIGWAPHLNYSMIPDVGADLRQIILEQNEGLCVTVVGTVPATTHMIVNCAWTEYKAR